MKLVIKNMTCDRSKTEVFTLISKLGLHPRSVEIGAVEIAETRLSITVYRAVESILRKNGYELIVDRKQVLVEKIKHLIIEMIYHSNELPTIKYSQYISAELGVNYTYLSKLFSKDTGTTIQQFIIAHKIERAKELLLFTALTLSEIAWKMHYSSTAHLSAQFRKVTGHAPSVFKELKTKNVARSKGLKRKRQEV